MLSQRAVFSSSTLNLLMVHMVLTNFPGAKHYPTRILGILYGNLRMLLSFLLRLQKLLSGDESLKWLRETIEFYMPALSGQMHCQENPLLREGNKSYSLNNIFGKLLWEYMFEVSWYVLSYCRGKSLVFLPVKSSVQGFYLLKWPTYPIVSLE